MFIFLQSDSFEANSRTTGGQVAFTQEVFREDAAIRRPYRGIQIKRDTYAVLSVRRGDNGNPIPLVSSSAVVQGDVDHKKKNIDQGKVSEYSDFILQRVEDARQEKTQIIETFGEAFAYFYGEKPRFITFSGLLMNTEDFNWRAQFWHNYDLYWRGSQLVQRNARMYLAYDTVVVEGYPVSASAVDDSNDPYSVPFTISMFMTNYFEYSSVGAMRFPGRMEGSLDVLNEELEKRRGSFVSTGVAVREANLNAAVSNQIPKENSVLSLMRAGVSAWNSAQVWLGDKLDVARRLMGGRALRMPVGAAAFYANSQTAELAPASLITTTRTGFDAATGDRFSKVTVNVNGVPVPIPGTKLRILGPVKFAPSWTSEVTGSARGMIYENYDEYPLRAQPSSLKDLLREDQWLALQGRLEAKYLETGTNAQMLANFNTVAAAGGLLQDVAGAVQAFRSGFGMLLTAANFVANPLGVAASAIGVTGQDIKRIGEGLSRGNFIPGLSNFIGSSARNTWENWADRVASQDVADFFSKGVTSSGSAKVGDVYNSNEYVPAVAAARIAAEAAAEEGVEEDEYLSKAAANQAALAEEGELAYEAVYGDGDYSDLVEAQLGVDANNLEVAEELPEDVEGAEANTDKVVQSLEEVYGNTDSAEFGEGRDDPATLEEVYGGGGGITRTQLSEEERAALLANAYAGNNYESTLQSEDTSGITSTDADDAEIDPTI